MEENSLNKQRERMNQFLFLLLQTMFLTLLFAFTLSFMYLLTGIALIVIFLRFGEKTFNIPMKQLLLPGKKTEVTVLDGLLMVCMFLSVYYFAEFLISFVFPRTNNPFAKILEYFPNIPLMTASVLVMGIAEEIMFRLIGLKIFSVYGKTLAILITSLLYAFGTNFIIAFLMGALSALLVFLTHNIWYAILFNIFSSGKLFLQIFNADIAVSQFLLLVAVVCLVPSVFVLRRPVFKQLTEWCKPKKIIANIKNHKEYYKQVFNLSGFRVLIVIHMISVLLTIFLL